MQWYSFVINNIYKNFSSNAVFIGVGERSREGKELIDDIANGDSDVNIEKLKEQIQDIYDAGKMPSSQYDELMGYIQDLE